MAIFHIEIETIYKWCPSTTSGSVVIIPPWDTWIPVVFLNTRPGKQKKKLMGNRLLDPGSIIH